MKKYSYIILTGILIIGSAILYTKSHTQVPVAAGKKTIKVGIMMPLSGDFGAVGDGIGKAAKLAIKDYEASHPNVGVEIVEEDDKFDVRTGIAAYTKMTSLDHIDGMIMVSTPILDAEHEKMKQDGIPVMSVGLQNNGVADDNIFQLTPDPNAAIAKLANYIQSNGNHTKLAIIHSTTLPASIAFYKTFTGVYKNNSVEFTINSNEEAKTIATKIAASHADAVVIMTTPGVGAELTKELFKLGVTPSKIGFYYDPQLSSGWSEYVKQLGDMKRLDGSMTLQFVTSDLTAFREKFKKEYGTDPAIYSEYGYDGIMALLDVHDSDNRNWVKAIKKTNSGGYSGAMKFDSKGVRIQEAEIWAVKNGEVSKI